MSSDQTIITQKSDRCCFWIDQSETSTKFKVAGVAIVAALTALLVIGGVLLILAQQGINLGGLNSIAQLIEAKWVYIGLGISSCVGVIDLIVIITMIRTHLDRENKGNQTNKGIIPDSQDPTSVDLTKHSDPEGEVHKQPIIYTKDEVQFLADSTDLKLFEAPDIGLDEAAVEALLLGTDSQPGVVQNDQVDLYCRNTYDYWPCEVTVRGKVVYAILIKKADKHIKKYIYACWTKESERSAALASGGAYSSSKGYTNVKILSSEKVATLVKDPTHLEHIEASKNRLKNSSLKSFTTFDLPTHTDKVIYTVVYYVPYRCGGQSLVPNIGKPQALHFDAKERRTEYIERLESFVDIGLVDHTCNGVPMGMLAPEGRDPRGIIRALHLDAFLVDKTTAFTLEIKGYDKTHSVLINREMERLKIHSVVDTPLKRLGARYLREQLVNLDHTAIEAQLCAETGLVATKLIDQKLTQPEHYWSESVQISGQDLIFLFFFSNQTLQTRIFFTTHEADAFTTTHKLTQNMHQNPN